MFADIDLASAETWWPATLAAYVTVVMAVAFLGIALRCLRIAKEPLAEGMGERPNRQTFLWVILAVVGSRFLVYLWAWLGHCLSLGAWFWPWHSFGALWVQWDAPHYLKLAEQWYMAPGVGGESDHLMLVFFPLFPMLLRGLRALFAGNTLAAAAALNLVCGAGAGCLLFRITARRYGQRKAWLALAYLLLNPFSLFLNAPYPEALFLLLTLAAIDAASQKRYLWAGLWGALSAFTRMLGLVAAGVILLEGLRHWLGRGSHRWRLCARVIAGALMVAMGFGAYLLLNRQITGAPFTFLDYQRQNWSQQFGSFWNSAYTTGLYMVRDLGQPDTFFGTWLPQAITMAAVPAMLALRQNRLPLPWAAYAWVYLFVALAPTWLLSGPRYVMALAVLPVLQCLLTDRRWFHAISLSLQGILLLVYTYLYAVVRSVL